MLKDELVFLLIPCIITLLNILYLVSCCINLSNICINMIYVLQVIIVRVETNYINI
ncbi:hypothetical protein OIU84_001854 [Salix udensis]|uniref:Uncharacterized protein n=1 Tax=Salix udensis TaxID=889485 RepID=A0AAD6P7E0_9ROSI|nr:hypothetical protein OIU84_001854 [Salix udensis]